MIETERAHILSMGEMMPDVEEQLDRRFHVHRSAKSGLQQIVDAYGPLIRGIATRGREPTTADLIARLPALEVVANFGVGYDSIDLVAAAERGIVVTNTPDVLNDEVADFTLALLLSTIRRLPQADRHVRTGRWLESAFPLSPTLRGRTVGILGMGRIGKAVAQRISAFDVPVVYHARREQEGLPYRYYPTLLAMAQEVDTLIAIVPGGAATRHIINAEILSALGPNGILINVARGSVVDESALIAALQNRTILAAGLDVFANEPHVPAELIALDNTVLLPHIGSATHHTRGRMGQLVVDNLISWFSGNGPITPVPETPWQGPPRP